MAIILPFLMILRDIYPIIPTLSGTHSLQTDKSISGGNGMKRIVNILILLILIFSAVAISAESLDRFGIIKENTGSLSTLEVLDTPDLNPGQRVEIVVVARGLQARWGEGQIRWRYRVLDEMGQTIVQSRLTPYTQRVSSSNWDLRRVEVVPLPRDLANGRYRIAWEVVDDHTNITYRGNARFTVGMPHREDPADGGAPQVQPTPPAAPVQDQEPEVPQPTTPQRDFVANVEGVEITLKEITRNSNRVSFRMTGVNTNTEEVGLRLWGRDTRIIDSNGREYLFDDVGVRTNIVRGIDFPTDIPLQIELELRGPATSVERIALIELAFLNTNDSVEWRDITIPWPALEPTN